MSKKSFTNMTIRNPKRNGRARSGRSAWFPYYASFNPVFARELLATAALTTNALVLDPWNGAGTTTNAAVSLGYQSRGYDLNPAPVVVAKARLLSGKESPSLVPLAKDIIGKSKSSLWFGAPETDPLAVWFYPSSVRAVRNIESAIRTLLMDESIKDNSVFPRSINGMSGLAAFFYTALFLTTRQLLARFRASNPTWVRKPISSRARLRPATYTVREAFFQSVKSMAGLMVHEDDAVVSARESDKCEVASSYQLPLPNASVDFVLSSPPYCTRIDYAVATMPELAVLGYSLDHEFKSLRQNLIGSTAVAHGDRDPMPEWGKTCREFLRHLAKHKSKASQTYYYKTHLQYFDGVSRSLKEISRVLRPGGRCVLVVQDSRYKEIHNDLPKVFEEMAWYSGMKLNRREDFVTARNMARINPRARAYGNTGTAVESVLCFCAA